MCGLWRMPDEITVDKTATFAYSDNVKEILQVS